MKRVAIVGATGQLGTALCREAATRGAAVVRAARRGDVDVVVDLDEPETFAALFDKEPEAVFVAAGYTYVDGAERDPELTMRANVRAPELLAQAAARAGIPLVFYSTDYVFDGERDSLRDPYREDDTPNPQSVYGKSKLLGEQAVLAAAPKSLVLRTGVVYGDDPNKKNFVYQLLRAARERQLMRIPNDQRNNPTFATDLAWASFELLARGKFGLLHAVGPTTLARHEFAALIGRVFTLDLNGVVEAKSTAELKQTTPRPLSCGLSTEKLRQALGRKLMAPDAGLTILRDLGLTSAGA